MMPETLSCPYCNSLVLLPRLPGPDQQIRCPRCQEAFLYLGELMDGPDTRPLVEQVLREHRALEDFEKRVGVPLDNIHHIVLGVRLSSLRIVAVVHTREPYELSDVKSAKGLNAKRGAPQGKRTLYRYTLMGTQLGGYFWPADDRTLVFALSDRDFEQVPETAGSPVDRFGPSLQEVLSKKLAIGTPVWTAAYHEDWASLPGQISLFAQLAQRFGAGAIPAIEPTRNGDQAALAELRTLAAWLQIENDTTIHLAAQGRDDEGAKELDAYLAAQGVEAGTLLKSPSGRDDAKPLGKVVSRQRDGDWVQA